eukprot:g1629.t1
MSTFSTSAVILGDLNDYISPADSCVNPLFTNGDQDGKTKGQSSQKTGSGTSVTLELENNPLEEEPDLIIATNSSSSSSSSKSKKIAKVSLSDCLACSGCVTSAEAVLVEQHSLEQFRKLTTNSISQYKIRVITMAPQAVASLANRFNVSWILMRALLTKYFQSQFHVHFTIDTHVGTQIAQIEAYQEFQKRMGMGTVPLSTLTVPSWKRPKESYALSRTHHFDILSKQKKTNNTNFDTSEKTPPTENILPIITSACPGWICYAEKTMPEILPYISRVKSPQQIIGALVKHVIFASSNPKHQGKVEEEEEEEEEINHSGDVVDQGLMLDHDDSKENKCTYSAKEILHVTLMPCFDKKLEASRKDFADETLSSLSKSDNNDGMVHDVDLVLTPTELEEDFAKWFTDSQKKASMSAVTFGLEQNKIDEGCGDEKTTLLNSKAIFLCGGESMLLRHLKEKKIVSLPAVAMLEKCLAIDVQRTAKANEYVRQRASYETSVAGGSGGYLHNLLRHICATENKNMNTLEWKTARRNPDFAWTTVELNDGNRFTFAKAYGFRNIQSVVRKLKKSVGKSPPFHYVELMACPKGCLNGGAQIKLDKLVVTKQNDQASTKGEVRPLEKKRRLDRLQPVRELFDAGMNNDTGSESSISVEKVYGKDLRSLFYTQYHAVPKMIDPLKYDRKLKQTKLETETLRLKRKKRIQNNRAKRVHGYRGTKFQSGKSKKVPEQKLYEPNGNTVEEKVETMDPDHVLRVASIKVNPASRSYGSHALKNVRYLPMHLDALEEYQLIRQEKWADMKTLDSMEWKKEAQRKKREMLKRKEQIRKALEAQVRSSKMKGIENARAEKKFAEQVWKDVEQFKEHKKELALKKLNHFKQTKKERAQFLAEKARQQELLRQQRLQEDNIAAQRAKANLLIEKQKQMAKREQKKKQMEEFRINNAKQLKKKAEERKLKVKEEQRLHREYIAMTNRKDAQRRRELEEREQKAKGRQRVAGVFIEQQMANDKDLEERNRKALEERYRQADEKARKREEDRQNRRLEIQQSIKNQVKARLDQQKQFMIQEQKYADEALKKAHDAVREEWRDKQRRRQENIAYRKELEKQIRYKYSEKKKKYDLSQLEVSFNHDTLDEVSKKKQFYHLGKSVPLSEVERRKMKGIKREYLW